MEEGINTKGQCSNSFQRQVAQRCTQKNTQDAIMRQSIWVCLNAHAQHIHRSRLKCTLNTGSRCSSTRIKMPWLVWTLPARSTLIKQIRCRLNMWDGGAAFVCIGRVGFQRVCSYLMSRCAKPAAIITVAEEYGLTIKPYFQGHPDRQLWNSALELWKTFRLRWVRLKKKKIFKHCLQSAYFILLHDCSTNWIYFQHFNWL